MGLKDAMFLGCLKTAWDQHFSKASNLILILSGSLSSWIERNILHDTGFVGRIDLDMTLQELPITACNMFWGSRKERISAYEKLRVFAVTGGVPRYLEAIVDGHTTMESLHDKLEKKQSGYLSTYIDELIECGFVSRDFTWTIKDGKESRLSLIRISDSYLRFYIKAIKPHKAKIERGTFDLPSNLDSMLGLQFENIILNNREIIWKAIGIDKKDVVIDNPFFQRKTKRHKGCQIDYMIQTNKNTLYICELKFKKKAIEKSIIEEVQQKLNRISLPRNFTLRPILIHINGVRSAVEDEEYFDEIINFGAYFEGNM